MALVRFTRRQPRIGYSPLQGSGVWSGFPDAENRINRFVERMMNEPFTGIPTEAIGWVPAMEIAETAEELTLTCELPGLEQKNVDVSIDDGVLTIRGEKVEERQENETEKKFYLYERNFGSFERSFSLPRGIDGSKISAEFANGLLKVHVPKIAEPNSSGRKIEIKSA